MAPCPQLAEPEASRILLARRLAERGASAMDHQCAQIAIAAFADAEQAGSASTGSLFRHQAEPCGKLAAMASMTTSVLIVEDEPEFMRRFSDAVLADAGLSLVAVVSTGRAAIAMLDAQAPDVMLVDLGLPDIDGVEVIRHGSRHPQCDVLVVTMFGDDQHVLASIEAGATGYLLKDAGAQRHRLAALSHELHAGGSPISPSIARRVLARFRVSPVPAAPAQPEASFSPLTERETEILRLTAKGLSFDTIGELGSAVSPHTVVAHVKKIYRKLAVHSRGEAVYRSEPDGVTVMRGSRRAGMLAWWLLLRRLVRVALLPACLVGGSAQAALQEPRQASVLAAPEIPRTPPPPAAAWAPVSLPDDAGYSRPGRDKMPAWYRIGFDYPDDPARQAQWAAYVPYFYDGGDLWLNGTLVASVQENTDRVYARTYRPLTAVFPGAAAEAGPQRAGDPRRGPQRLPAALPACRHRAAGRDPTAARPAPVLDPHRARAHGARLRAGGRLRGVHLVAPPQRSALRPVRPGGRAVGHPHHDLPDRCHAHGPVGVVACDLPERHGRLRGRDGGVHAALHQHHRPGLERGLLAYWLLGPLSFAIGGFAAEPFVARYWLGGMMVVGLLIIATSIGYARRRGTLAAAALSAVMAFAVLVGVHDYLITWDPRLLGRFLPEWVGHRIHVLHFGSNMLLLAMAALLTARFLRTLSSLEDLNRTLETRVADRERELAANYARLAALEREHAASEERQLIMRELHDGLGSQLFTSLSRVERGDMNDDQIAAALRSCIADMRLALDALASDEHDLSAALGNFMFRWEAQLVAAGVRPRWDIDLPDDALTLSPHAALQLLRVAQEALTNVLKHAQATQVQVRLCQREGMLEMDIEDDGRGLGPEPPRQGHGMGNMRSRAQRLGGALELKSTASGTCVELRLPMSAATA